ncbi:hypothetical protein K1719_014763 [Acacia pycnantha]|nr:hypothetical protein K1719_014763 [Acacia pycnantha]
MTSLQLDKIDLIWSDDMSLRINASGQVIHAYLNGQRIGIHWAKYGVLYDDEVEFKIKLNKGKNVISLLNVTNGLHNYGAFFDTWNTGLVGPIEVVGKKGNETIIKDLASHKWHYGIGLDGWEKKFFSEEFSSKNKWASDHLPINRSFTWYKVLDNLKIVLFLLEEMGGNPSYVNFQTVSVGTACGTTYENHTLELSCQSRPISAIKFASFGDPQGTCGSFYKGTCESSNNALSIIEKACVGKQSCSIDVTENTFGSTNCGNITKRLAVETVC